jgi:predicted restriction endonuclease
MSVTFGEIENIQVGQIFNSRESLAKARIHTPPMGGIWGASEGACSIVLSGGYEDDIDDLNYILYTGQGGQDIPGGKQVSDQEFVRGNKGLMLSCDYNLPVRVTRGHQIKNGPTYGGIAIGAHIKGLGKPHNGPDVIENMICLCPNHHEQFDDYGYYIDPETCEIKGLKDFDGKKITVNKKHKIDKEFLEYHLEQFKKNN